MISCPLCGHVFEPESLACREAGCPLAELTGCVMICCPACGYQIPDERKSTLAGIVRGMQKKIAAPPELSPRPVCGLKAGQSAVVSELKFDDATLLDRLCGYGIVPGTVISVAQTRPAVILNIGQTAVSIDKRVAEGILVDIV